MNVQADSQVITKSGNGGGNGDSCDKRISCGSKCSAFCDNGATVTLTPKANSGSVFASWSGIVNRHGCDLHAGGKRYGDAAGESHGVRPMRCGAHRGITCAPAGIRLSGRTSSAYC